MKTITIRINETTFSAKPNRFNDVYDVTITSKVNLTDTDTLKVVRDLMTVNENSRDVIDIIKALL